VINHIDKTSGGKPKRFSRAGLFKVIRTFQAYRLTSSHSANNEEKRLLSGEQEEPAASHFDLSSLKQTEVMLLEGEELFRAAFDIPSVGMCQAEPYSGRFLRVNRYFCEMTGYSEGELLTRSFTEITHPEDRASNKEQLLSLLRGEISEFRIEKRYIRKDGSVCWGDVTVNLMRAPGGRPLRALAVVQNITDQKRTEMALRESEARTAGIINSAMDAIISVNDRQQIVLFNVAAEKMFGYSAQEVLGQPLARIIPERFRAAHEHHIRRFGMTGETTRAMGALSAVSGVRRNGKEFPIEASISQIETDGQRLFTVILRDITERVRANDQLIEQAALLDQSHEAILVRDLDGNIL
jgi:PAS domain S-box-containing protein